ncbi:MAG: hypothetical protein ACOH5I_19110 [Oligoflexus sp.]
MKVFFWGILLVSWGALTQAMALTDPNAQWLDLEISGRDCPKLSEVRIEDKGIRLILAEDFQLTSRAGARLQRGFCQVAIQAIAGKEGRKALSLEGIKLTGVNRQAPEEEVRMDLTAYRQGDENHWQHKETITLSKDEEWQFEKELANPLILTCDDKKSLQFKVALTTKKAQGLKKTLGDISFSLTREWFFHTSWKDCT